MTSKVGPTSPTSGPPPTSTALSMAGDPFFKHPEMYLLGLWNVFVQSKVGPTSPTSGPPPTSTALSMARDLFCYKFLLYLLGLWNVFFWDRPPTVHQHQLLLVSGAPYKITLLILNICSWQNYIRHVATNTYEEDKARKIFMKIILVGRDGTQKPTGQWSYPFPAVDGGGRGRLALLLFSFTAFVESNEENEKNNEGKLATLFCCISIIFLLRRRKK